MKKLITLTICLMAAGMAFAQQSATPKKKLIPAEQYTAAHKTAIGGYIRDAHNMPIPDVKAFVYRTDSSAEISYHPATQTRWAIMKLILPIRQV